MEFVGLRWIDDRKPYNRSFNHEFDLRDIGIGVIHTFTRSLFELCSCDYF